jgi:hypothetical protein
VTIPQSEKDLDQELRLGGKRAPRLNPEDIENCIEDVQYHHFPGTRLIVCAIRLRNGFYVIGESSCVSDANFDPAIGKRLAAEKARSRIWELEGYLLREKIFLGQLG